MPQLLAREVILFRVPLHNLKRASGRGYWSRAVKYLSFVVRKNGGPTVARRPTFGNSARKHGLIGSKNGGGHALGVKYAFLLRNIDNVA